MKKQWVTNGLSVLALAITPFLVTQTTISATFEEKDVKQENFIAVAVPLKSNAYKFLILEQVSDKKKCWNTVGQNPAKVDLLLLTFDFTKICNRSLDSNGYSLRSAGKDLGLDYFLTIEKRENELVLMGVPRLGQKGEKMEIARTYGLETRYPTQLILDPNWRFSRRAFKGKALGHVYLSQK